MKSHGSGGRSSAGPKQRQVQAARRQAGFSLIELLIVVCIALVVTAMAVMQIQNTVRGVRLRSSATSYANLLQQARIRAVHDDNFYSVVVPAGPNPQAVVDINSNGVYDAGEPLAPFSSGVVAQPFAAGPNVNQLKLLFLPPDPLSQASVNTTLAGPTFGPRGLPCTPLVTAGVTTCPMLNPNVPATSFITFLQNLENGSWMAVTVSPAGRIRQWTYDLGTNTWSPLT